MKKLNQLSLMGIILILCLSFHSCTTIDFRYLHDPQIKELLDTPPAVYPATRFIVFSDPHIYNITLGKDGPAFETYLHEDRKMLVQSEEIMQSAVEIIEHIDADFVIVPGDLTKDGEYICHELFLSYIKEIEQSGKPVYVIPGNHDILNYDAVKFTGKKTEHVKRITPQDFKTLYANYGYNDALFEDPNSLSYITEPVPGLLLFALDSCIYNENSEQNPTVVDGEFSPQTLLWIEDMLIQAIEQKKAVMGMMHHGVLEHYTDQEKHFEEYVVNNHQQVAELFAQYNMRIIFSGHYHAQDITNKTWPYKKYIYDIETGSLITFPCPIRICQITPSQQLKIKTRRIEKIESRVHDFPQFAEEFIFQGIVGIATDTLTDMCISPEEARLLAPQVARAFVAHYQGDEVAPANMLDLEGISGFASFIIGFRKDLIEDLWHDLEPLDNDITINLSDGTWSEN